MVATAESIMGNIIFGGDFSGRCGEGGDDGGIIPGFAGGNVCGVHGDVVSVVCAYRVTTV